VTSDKPSYHIQLSQLKIDDSELGNLMTPALAIYPEIVGVNIESTLRLLGGDTRRWQPHVKTAKLETVMRQLCARGVTQFKSATTLEMLTACEAGAKEILMSYPSAGARARRVQEIAGRYPQVRICAMVESADQVSEWKTVPVPLYIDINPGMDRTGIQEDRVQDIVVLAAAIESKGIEFAGLHYYDGHNRQLDLRERTRAAFQGYERLLDVVQALRIRNISVRSVITSGTPALPCALSFPGFFEMGLIHRVSPGTVTYNDLSCQAQLPEEWGYQFAAVVIASVVSHPRRGLITCDAGHKAVSSDAGLPNCSVLGHPSLEPLHPSEEHLPIRVPEGSRMPDIGEFLYLVPRHVCPTVNNFDEALLVRRGRISEIASVSARGRESPILRSVGSIVA
jgi:D-serine deaminase-like pyridoxal phosphate-dependent protein